MVDRMAADFYCQNLVATKDHDHHLTVLYAPAHKRAALYALYAFSYEISKIGSQVSEPMIGEIRLHWWRDSLVDRAPDQSGNPEVLTAFQAAIKDNALSTELVLALIDGHIEALYETNPPDETAREAVLAQTAGNLAVLAALILERTADGAALDLARRLGVAWGAIGLIRGAKAGKISLIRADIISLVQQAKDNLDHVRAQKNQISTALRSLFLLAPLSRRSLRLIEKADYNPQHINEEADALFRQLALFGAVLFNRV